MRKLCALLSFVSIAALQTWPAAAASPEIGRRPFSKELWRLHQAGARTSPPPEIRVHFFHPDQVIRVYPQRAAAPVVRPTVRMSRPAPATPAKLLVVAATRSAPRPQPEVRSGR